MTDEVKEIKLPQGGFHPELVKARRKIENAQQQHKEDPSFTQRDLDEATKEFLTDRLRYDQLDKVTTSGIKAQINHINDRLSESELSRR